MVQRRIARAAAARASQPWVELRLRVFLNLFLQVLRVVLWAEFVARDLRKWLACPLQHRQATLLAGLQTIRASGWLAASPAEYEEVESKPHFPLPHTTDGGYLIAKEAALH